MRTNGRSEAILGGLLWGDQPVRYMFMDEAGTSAREPVTVIVGLIAHADDHVLSAEAAAIEAMGGVPSQFKDGFVFHATEVFGDAKYQLGGWSLTDRLNLLYDMMSIPRRIGMAICLAAQWRGAVDFTESYGALGLRPDQSDHLAAFNLCVCVADRNIRRHAGPRELATIVAEDHPEMRRFLKAAPKILKTNPISLPQDMLRRTALDDEAGYIKQSGDLRVTRIRNSVHFVAKDDDPLVQIADACAYGFRRYFAQEKFGNEFARSILGDETMLRVFAPPGGAECWWPKHTSQSSGPIL